VQPREEITVRFIREGRRHFVRDDPSQYDFHNEFGNFKSSSSTSTSSSSVIKEEEIEPKETTLSLLESRNEEEENALALELTEEPEPEEFLPLISSEAIPSKIRITPSTSSYSTSVEKFMDLFQKGKALKLADDMTNKFLDMYSLHLSYSLRDLRDDSTQRAIKKEENSGTKRKVREVEPSTLSKRAKED